MRLPKKNTAGRLPTTTLPSTERFLRSLLAEKKHLWSQQRWPSDDELAQADEWEDVSLEVVGCSLVNKVGE